MAAPSAAAAHYRAKIGALSTAVNAGYRQPDDPELLAAKLGLATEMLAEHVERVARDIGPLTDEQCQRITQLLLQAGAA